MINVPKYIPYVYEIVYKPTGQRYIGVRYGRRIVGKLPEQDLGVTYFSSSKHPLLERINQEKYPENFEYNVLACFPNDSSAAREYEEHLHLTCNIGEDETFLNNAIANRYAGFTKKSSLKGAETRKNILTEEGMTIAESIGKRASATRNTKVIDGMTIQERTNQKISEKTKGTRSGADNANSKSYKIYRDDGALFCYIPLEENIKDYLKRNDLPMTFYESQIKGGKPILNEQMPCHLSMDIHKHLYPYIGWYCVSINKDGSENHFYDKSETPRYVMIDLESNVIETFGRSKTLKNAANERGWPMNSIYKSYKNGGEPVYYYSRPEEKTKQENNGTRWLCNYCFVKMDKDGNFYHHWLEENKKIVIGE